MIVEVFKLDLEELMKQIGIYKYTSNCSPRYIVMSQGTLEEIENLAGYTPVFDQEYSSCELCGVKIAINNGLRMGHVDIV